MRGGADGPEAAPSISQRFARTGPAQDSAQYVGLFGISRCQADLLCGLRCLAPWFVRNYAPRLALWLALSSALVFLASCAAPCLPACATKRHTLLSGLHRPAPRLAQQLAVQCALACAASCTAPCSAACAVKRLGLCGIMRRTLLCGLRYKALYLAQHLSLPSVAPCSAQCTVQRRSFDGPRAAQFC